MSRPDDGASGNRRRLYGRRRGKRLRAGRLALVERLLPELAFDIDTTAPAALDPAGLFPAAVAEVWLEIGFGNGEHLAYQAAANPGIGLIGVEPYLAGVARMVAYIDERRLANVRLFIDDARLLLPCLADASITRLFTLFPDPWPKTRHHKRRLVAADTVAEASRILTPGGEWLLATDDMDYCRWMLGLLTGRSDFAWTAERAEDWRRRPADWPETRYEAKAAAAGRQAAYLRFRRHPN
ncbi:MAG: tRNA (guanosine(46)-N7)-methyltransferase TrmB [Alphaproteobacteria bacterium]|nr:tRNA (guanosine(46)-N7)-methyltransferase TrmB [Alphaproteobacteria bacterium]